MSETPMSEAPVEGGAASEGPAQDPGRQYCDVVYAFGGGTCASPTRGARFHQVKTGIPSANQYYDVGTNCASPRRGGGVAVPSPFTPSAFPRGFLRLRFRASGGAPTAGAVEVVEYLLPVELAIRVPGGTTVYTDVDHSAGLLRGASTGCAPGVTGCIAAPPTLERRCRAVASGMLAGTRLTFGGCGVATPAACVGARCSPTEAQLRWSVAGSQAPSAGGGCLTDLSSWGGVRCTGPLCALVPGMGAPVQATWDQALPTITFSSSAYGAPGTTLSMLEMTIPDEPGDVYSGTRIVTATVVHTECGTLDALSCDEQ
jgi:hypothetical protein